MPPARRRLSGRNDSSVTGTNIQVLKFDQGGAVVPTANHVGLVHRPLVLLTGLVFCLAISLLIRGKFHTGTRLVTSCSTNTLLSLAVHIQ